MEKNTSDSPAPWWKFGHVWMVFAGPAIVVVASLITVYIAMTRIDPVIDENYYQNGIDINKIQDKAALDASLAPAMKARNHAATGVVLTPEPSSKP